MNTCRSETPLYVKSCHVCQNDKEFSWIHRERNDTIDPTYWRIPEDYYVQIRCRKCGVLFLDSAIDDEYVIINHQREARSDETIRKMLDGFEKHRYPSLKKCADLIDGFRNALTGNKLLDIGCSLGTYLKIAQLRGFDVFGIDLAPEFAEYVKRYVTENAFATTLKEIDFPENFFDIITCWETLEHMVNIRKFLLEVRSILKRGGYIALTVPASHYVLLKIFLFTKIFDKIGISKRLSLRDKLLIHSHIYSFSTKSLIKLLECTGFVSLKISPLDKPLIDTKGLGYNTCLSAFNKIAKMLFHMTGKRLALSLSIFVIAKKA